MKLVFQSRLVSRLFVTLFLGVTFFLYTDSAQAQLFGSRSIKRTLNRQGSRSVGQVEGNERFVRGRRGRQSFVGADQGDTTGFVGNEQGRTSGRIASPTGGLKKMADKSSQINRAYPNLKKTDIYPAIIVLPKSLIQSKKTDVELKKLNLDLTSELTQKVNDSISVSVVGRAATLRGVVPSAKEKGLAELLIRFEPGIDEVRNEIEVANQ